MSTVAAWDGLDEPNLRALMAAGCFCFLYGCCIWKPRNEQPTPGTVFDPVIGSTSGVDSGLIAGVVIDRCFRATADKQLAI